MRFGPAFAVAGVLLLVGCATNDTPSAPTDQSVASNSGGNGSRHGMNDFRVLLLPICDNTTPGDGTGGGGEGGEAGLVYSSSGGHHDGDQRHRAPCFPPPCDNGTGGGGGDGGPAGLVNSSSGSQHDGDDDDNQDPCVPPPCDNGTPGDGNGGGDDGGVAGLMYSSGGGHHDGDGADNGDSHHRRGDRDECGSKDDGRWFDRWSRWFRQGPFGLLRIERPEATDATVSGDVKLRHLTPFAHYLLQWASDETPNHACTGTTWVTVGPGAVLEAVPVDADGNGRQTLTEDIPTIPPATVVDIQFRVIDSTTAAIALVSRCRQFRSGS